MELDTRLILLTGKPGSGKTTLVENLHRHFEALGHSAGGVLTREVRTAGRRTGFKIEDLRSGEVGWLAKAQEGSGPMYGRYCIMFEDLERIGVKALASALTSNDVDLVFVDEIGPMEMSSRRFAEAVENLLLHPSKIVVATFKEGWSSPTVQRALGTPRTVLLHLTETNRDDLFHLITEMLDKALRKSSDGGSRT